jgi:CRP-like cAMP-binding protein
MEYKRLAANEVIFNIGDVGDYFYILIHGKVQLMLPNPEIQGIIR